MKVILTKKHAVHVRELKKGSVLDVLPELGEYLIKKKVAKEFHGMTPDDEMMEEVKDAIHKEESES